MHSLGEVPLSFQSSAHDHILTDTDRILIREIKVSKLFKLV